MVNSHILIRVESGHKYLKALAWSLNVGWVEAYKKSQNNVPWIMKMALIHPEHYRNLVEYQQEKDSLGYCPIRFKRNFDSDVGQLKCRSQFVWGYECELEQIEVAMDHHFPFSLGGPTEGSNKIYLCKLHNKLKAADMHFYKWDAEEPEWLGKVIERVGKYFDY